MGIGRCSFALVVCVAICGWLAAGASAAPVMYSTVALTGQPAPGMSAGVNYASFTTPTLNDSGQLAYSAALTGTGVTTANDTALFAGSFAAPQLVAREGDAAPGAPAGVSYASFQFPGAFNDAGEVVFFVGRPSVTGAGVTTANDEAIFAGHFTAPQLVAREGSAAPGTAPGVNYSVLHSFGPSDSGRLAYHFNLAGAGVTSANNSAIFAGNFAAPQLIVRTGNAAPGTAAGVNYSSLDLRSIGEGGRVAFEAELTGTGVTSSNDVALYAGDFAAPQLVAREGSAAPGTAAGVRYSAFGLISIKASGQVAYSTTLAGTGVTTANDRAIYAGSIASPQIVAREGGAAPGTPAGVTYASVAGLNLNDAGQVAYTVDLTGTGVTSTNNVALYAGSIAAPQLIAREGDAAPGTPAGVKYSAFTNPPGINNAGQVAYFAPLTGPGVTTANDFALFVFDPVFGELFIVREGDLFDVGGGDLRTISGAVGDIGFDTSNLSNDGTLAFRLHFTDGTEGVFTALVPEPGSLSLLAITGAMMLRRGRRSATR